MPTYEYSCTTCEGTFEIFHGMTASAPATCPGCGAEGSLRKLLSAGSGLIFKGSGFYITDYKKSGTSDSSTSDKKAAESKTESKTEGKSESKENKPSEPKPKESSASKATATA